MNKGMKFTRKNAVVAAGLSAVLALTPVAVPASMAFADGDGAAAGQSASAASHDVAVYVNGSNYGNWTMPDQAASVSDLPKGDAPEGQEFTGLWTVTWEDGSTTTGKSLDELKSDWAGVASITAEYQAIEQGGEEQPEEPAAQINVTFKYDNTSVATTAGEDGNIDADALGLPENYTWTWTDAQGTVHEFSSDQLATYIFTESCTVTGAPAQTEEPAEPAQQIDVTFKYDGTSVATTADEDGYIDADALGLPENYTWTWTDAQGTVHEFDSDMLAGYIFTESCTVTGTANETADPVSEFVTVHLVDSDGTPIRDVVVQRNTSNWSGVLTDPVKEGYVFQGWQQEGASDIVTDLDSLVMAVDDSVNELTFKAVWKEATPEQRYIAVNYYDGDELIGTGAVLNGTNQWSGTTTPSKDGYTFLGWQFEGETSVTPDLSKVVYTADEQVTEINLYAQWQENQPAEEQRYITVNYYDGDKLLGTGAVLNGTSDWSGIVNPTKDGYTFAGWQFEGEDAIYTDAELDNVVYIADEQVTEINLYAQWQENAAEAQYITVHFYDEFGNFLGDGAVLNGTSDWSGPIVAPEVDGYTFVGWAEEGGDVYAPELLGQVVVAVPENVTELTYIAHYAKDPQTQTHKVTFDDCLESTTNQVVEVEDGDTVAKPADPVCEGYKFLGWFTDTALTQEYDFNTPVTSDMTLYAKWQQVEVAGDDNANEGTEAPVAPGIGTAAADENSASDEAAAEDKLPQTGDNTMAVAGGVAAVAGISAIAALGAALKRRFQ